MLIPFGIRVERVSFLGTEAGQSARGRNTLLLGHAADVKGAVERRGARPTQSASRGDYAAKLPEFD